MKTLNFLHPELMSTEAPEVIKEKIDALEKMKEERYKLFEELSELERKIDLQEKELSKLDGVLFEVKEQKSNATNAYAPQKVNILLQGVSNSKF